MTSTEMDVYSERRGGGLFWFWAPIVLILFVGGAFSLAAYFSDSGLTVVESVAAGFGGLAALIVGLFAAAVGILVGLFGALLGLATAGGAVAVTLFIVASPILAIILFLLLMRRPKCECPEPGAE